MRVETCHLFEEDYKYKKNCYNCFKFTGPAIAAAGWIEMIQVVWVTMSLPPMMVWPTQPNHAQSATMFKLGLLALPRSTTLQMKSKLTLDRLSGLWSMPIRHMELECIARMLTIQWPAMIMKQDFAVVNLKNSICHFQHITLYR